MAKIIDFKVRREVYEKCNGRCAYCGSVIYWTSVWHHKQFTVDHIIPISELKKTGAYKCPHNLSNLLPACYDCNVEKGSMSLDEFREIKLRKFPFYLDKRFYFEKMKKKADN